MIRAALLTLTLAVPILGGAIHAAPAAEPLPARIAVAGGDLAEIVAELGALDRVVMVDTTARHPARLADLPQAGYLRALSAEGILSVSPDLVLLAADAGPPAALDQLRAAGLRVALAPDGTGPDSVGPKVRFVAAALGLPEAGDVLATRIETDLARLAALRDRLGPAPGVLFILTLRDGAPVVGGLGTPADAIIRLAGGRNVAERITGWMPMSPEAVLAAAPDVILMMEGHAERAGGLSAILARPDIAGTPAGREGRALAMDGMLLLGFGPRTPVAVRMLMQALHPGADLRAGL